MFQNLKKMGGSQKIYLQVTFSRENEWQLKGREQTFGKFN